MGAGTNRIRKLRIMIELYFWTTPNGYKPLLFLEDTGLPYRIVPVDIGRGAQFEPAFGVYPAGEADLKTEISRPCV